MTPVKNTGAQDAREPVDQVAPMDHRSAHVRATGKDDERGPGMSQQWGKFEQSPLMRCLFFWLSLYTMPTSGVHPGYDFDEIHAPFDRSVIVSWA